MSLQIVILAAGLGKRMRSDLPKVLHPLGGKPMLAHVIDAARSLEPSRIVVVVGHGAERVREQCAADDIQWAIQDPPQGTGHAVEQALPLLTGGAEAPSDGRAAGDGSVLILYGDVPLVEPASLRTLIDSADAGSLAIQTQILDDATGYGRVVRDANDRVVRIVEHKDASPEQRRIREMYTGIMAAPAAWLAAWVRNLDSNNEQKEFYLTDVIAMATADGVTIASAQPAHPRETMGINSKLQLAQVERQLMQKRADALLEAGVTLADPSRVDVRGELRCGRDVTIDINTVFGGSVTLGDRVNIGANCVIIDCTIGPETTIHPFTHLEGVTIGAGCALGPYSHVHPDTVLGDGVDIGNFVEVKRSTVGNGSKAKHLSYIGDTTVGRDVNVGAGTITCNYDGANKHRTVIGDNVHIGSDVQLVAPVQIGAGATVGAGTTVWKDVADGALVVNEKTQVARTDWQRPVKVKKK